ncbi:Omp28-related outer membrane protein [Bacteroidia bacterium]|nr:Omp28-related outer membrane protein [Bacteroidia bacterium]
MNKVLLMWSVLVFFFACKESTPPINFNEDESLVLKDTCYLLNINEIPAPAFRGILIEDLTGVRCVACPNAALAAAEIKNNATTNNVVVLGLYSQNPKSLTFPFGGYEDLRTETAQQIGTNIFNFSNVLPAGGVNRTLFDGETTINIPFEKWLSKANRLNGEKAVVNIDLIKEKKDETTYTVQAKFTFTNTPIAEPFYSVFLLEDNLNHPQYNSNGTDSSYVHQHVLRSAYTPYNGSPLLSNNSNCQTVERGTVIEKGWELVIPENVNTQNASIVILVNYNDGNNKEVIQCQELKLK